jgi:hypothetical protein
MKAMMDITERNAEWLFRGLLLSVVLFFLWIRPLQSPWHPFIAGDGLGYYSYLPATFIYGDRDYTFEWFNAAHDSNYVYSAFSDPSENILVKYGDRKINKYYQGLAFIWMPFFFAAHAFAKLSGYAADGFSAPYQAAIGLASLFYLILGLVYLRRLLARRFGQLPAVISTGVIFYSTYLCTYAVFANSLSHLYSFTFITMFLYFTDRFFNGYAGFRTLLSLLLCLCIAACIRPLTILIVLTIPAFVPRGFSRPSFMLVRPGWKEAVLFVLIVAAAVFTIGINYRQTGSPFAYNYAGESFDFLRPRFFDALISYHQGLFVYAPAILIALCGLLFMPLRQRLLLGGFFFAIIYIYSCWWYWPITKRALVDFYAIPAFCLAALLHGVQRGRYVLLVLLFLSVAYFQLKSLQVRKGILDENATYGEIFWRHFFRTKKASIYPIAPSTILYRSEKTEDFESGFPGPVSGEKPFAGDQSLVLDSAHYIHKILEAPLPDFFARPGFRKVRFSFRCYFGQGVGRVHVFMQFFSKEGKVLKEVPFYLNAEDIFYDNWDLKEFGIEIPEGEGLETGRVDKVVFTVWNVDARGRIFIDEAKAEFVLTDRSFETIR